MNFFICFTLIVLQLYSAQNTFYESPTLEQPQCYMPDYMKHHNESQGLESHYFLPQNLLKDTTTPSSTYAAARDMDPYYPSCTLLNTLRYTTPQTTRSTPTQRSWPKDQSPEITFHDSGFSANPSATYPMYIATTKPLAPPLLSHTVSRPCAHNPQKNPQQSLPYSVANNVSERSNHCTLFPPTNVTPVTITTKTHSFHFKPLPPHTNPSLKSPELISLICNLAKSIQKMHPANHHNQHIMAGITNLWKDNDTYGTVDYDRPIFSYRSSYATCIVFLLRMLKNPTLTDKQLPPDSKLFRVIRFHTLASSTCINQHLDDLKVVDFLFQKSMPVVFLKNANIPASQIDCARRVAQSMRLLSIDCSICKVQTEDTPLPYQIDHRNVIAQHFVNVWTEFTKFPNYRSHSPLCTLHQSISKQLNSEKNTQQTIETSLLLSVFALEAVLYSAKEGYYPLSLKEGVEDPEKSKTYDLWLILYRTLNKPELLQNMHHYHLDSALGCPLYLSDNQNIYPTNYCKSAVCSPVFFAFLDTLLPQKSQTPIQDDTRVIYNPTRQPYNHILLTLLEQKCPSPTYDKANILSQLCTQNPYAAQIYVALTELSRLVQSPILQDKLFLKKLHTTSCTPADFVFTLTNHAIESYSAYQTFTTQTFQEIFKSPISRSLRSFAPMLRFLNILNSQEMFWDTLTADYALQEKKIKQHLNDEKMLQAFRELRIEPENTPLSNPWY